MNLSWWTFGPSLVESAFSTLAVGFVGYDLTQIWLPETWLVLGGMAIAVSLLYGIVEYLVILDQQDRQLISDLILKPIRKYLSFSTRGTQVPGLN